MTDFYKKHYGYEDDIKLKDHDISNLEKGMVLKKLNPSREEFNERFYRLDSNANTLVASTKEFRKKEKVCKYIIFIKLKCLETRLIIKKKN